MDMMCTISPLDILITEDWEEGVEIDSAKYHPYLDELHRHAVESDRSIMDLSTLEEREKDDIDLKIYHS